MSFLMIRGLPNVSRALLHLLLATAVVGCDHRAPSEPIPVLLFAGTGTSPGDISAVARILDQRHVRYTAVTSEQLNAMPAAQLMDFRLIIVPGGDFMKMGASLAPATMARIHDAVQQGLNYLGICAGAFLAGDGQSYYNSFDLTTGVRFGFYAAESEGVRKAAVLITGINVPAIEHYWEDGPELTGWGSVVAKYPNGTPAVVEGMAGQGWVILSGVHPEAPESWRRGMNFRTPASAANTYAGTLVEAALAGTELPHY